MTRTDPLAALVALWNSLCDQTMPGDEDEAHFIVIRTALEQWDRLTCAGQEIEEGT